MYLQLTLKFCEMSALETHFASIHVGLILFSVHYTIKSKMPASVGT